MAPVLFGVTTTEWPCSDSTNATCSEQFPNWVSSDHVKWIANQMLSSYVIAEAHTEAYSYPWTRLGYTYDWKPGAVVVKSKEPYAAYCGRN